MLLTIIAQIAWRGFSTSNSVFFVRNSCQPSFTLSAMSFPISLIVGRPLKVAVNDIKCDLEAAKKSTMLSRRRVEDIVSSSTTTIQSCLVNIPTSASATSLQTVGPRQYHHIRCSTRGCPEYLWRATCGLLGVDGEQTVDAWQTSGPSMEGAWVHFNLSRHRCQFRQRPYYICSSSCTRPFDRSWKL